MEIEESQVYPQLEQVDNEIAEEANVEHGLVQGLDKLQELIGMPGFGAAVDMLKAGIGHHVEEEETEVFPQLREKLGLGGGSPNSDVARRRRA